VKPNELITEYNRLTQRLCGRRGTFPLRHSPKMLGVAEKFIGWAKRNEVDSRHWIIARHDAIKWRRRIPLKDLHRVGDGFLESYQSWMAGRLSALDQEVSDRKSVVADTSRVSKLTVLGESAKEAFANDRFTCLGSALTLTGGWHPASAWCQSCSLTEQCSGILEPRVKNARS